MKDTIFFVRAEFFEYLNRGTQHETKGPYTEAVRGPFSSRTSAEAFAHGLATQKDLVSARIEEAPWERP